MEDNYFRDIGRYLSQIQALNMRFQQWDYQPTIVPMIDAYAPYESLKDANISHSYCLLDPNRELLLLRADSTLFLARNVSKHIQKQFLPLRLSYSNSVIRPSKEINNNNEIRQSGIELIGVANIAGDFEIILLTHSTLDSIAPAQFCIHIGSREIVRKAIYTKKPNLSKKELDFIYQCFAQRDYAEISKLFGEHFAHAMLDIMEVQDFRKNLNYFSSLFPSDSPALTHYITLIEAISQSIGENQIRCDFSEIGAHDYYANIVFSAYAKNKPLPVAQGGRYDSLMQHFGVQVPAVGATIFPHVLMSYLLEQNDILNLLHDNKKTKSNAFNALSDLTSPSVEDLVLCARAQIGRYI